MLKEEIKDDLNRAIKGKDENACATLRMLLADVLSKEKEKRYNLSKEGSLTEQELNDKSCLTDEEMIQSVSSEFKKRKEAIAEYEKAGRNELAEKEKAELKVLEKYMPEQLSKEEIEKLAQEAIDKVQAEDMKDMGKVMAELMPKVKGKADGQEVNKIIKDILCKN